MITESLYDIYTLWLHEIKRFVRSRARMLGSGGQPLLWLAIIGVGLASFVAASGIGINYLEFIAPGIIGMTLLFSALFAGVSVVWERQFGFLREILVAPVKRSSVVVGKTLGGATIALFSGIFVLIVVIVFGVVPLGSLTAYGIASTLFFMALVSACFVGVGLIIAANVGNVEGFQVIMNFLGMPLFFLSGALFPLDTAPLWLSLLSRIDPLTYAVDGMRASLGMAHIYGVWIDAAAVLVSTAIFVGIAALTFKRLQGKRG